MKSIIEGENMKNRVRLCIAILPVIFTTEAFPETTYTAAGPDSLHITVEHNRHNIDCCKQNRTPFCSIRTRTDGHFQIFAVLIDQNMFGEFDTYAQAVNTIRQLRLDRLCR